MRNPREITGHESTWFTAKTKRTGGEGQERFRDPGNSQVCEHGEFCISAMQQEVYESAQAVAGTGGGCRRPWRWWSRGRGGPTPSRDQLVAFQLHRRHRFNGRRRDRSAASNKTSKPNRRSNDGGEIAEEDHHPSPGAPPRKKLHHQHDYSCGRRRHAKARAPHRK
uniref:Uncharacterized protein n=1 Tax=Sphaerodactylus townsendi TaxID=933632 RepID=A0ACB8FJ92_9SAUR